MTTYSKRENAFEKGEHVWNAGPDTLVWTRPTGEAVTLLWRDVASVRAAYAPTRFKSWRHVLELKTRRGASILIDNGHFKGVGDFEDRSKTFTPFALACIERVAAHAPQAKAWLGSGPAGYWAQVLFAGGMLALLMVVLFTLPIGNGIAWIVFAKLAFIAVSLPLAIRWMIVSRPRSGRLTEEAFRPVLPAPV